MIIRPAGVRSAGSGFCKFFFFFDQGAAIPVRGSRSGYFAPHVFSVYRSPYTLILVDNGYFTNSGLPNTLFFFSGIFLIPGGHSPIMQYTCTGFHALYWEITGGHHFFLHLQENGG